MANYKGIKGFKVQSVASDPSPLIEGQLWYNTASAALKMEGLGAGSWAAGGLTNTARGHLAGAGSSHTAGLIVGGIGVPAVGVIASTESYDGTTWTEVNDLNAARQYFTAAGTQTAAITAGGMSSVYLDEVLVSEIWDGTSWSEEADLATARSSAVVCGTTTATLCVAGGFGNNAPNLAIVEEYNGTAWAEVGDINTARRALGGATAGTPTAGLVFAGIDYPDPPYGFDVTESYNGTTWTEVADMGTQKYSLGSCGTQGDSLAFGGSGGNPFIGGQATTEAWNGTSWTEVADLAYTQYNSAPFGGTSSAMYATGQTQPTPRSQTNEWTRSTAVQTVTVS